MKPSKPGDDTYNKIVYTTIIHNNFWHVKNNLCIHFQGKSCNCLKLAPEWELVCDENILFITLEVKIPRVLKYVTK